MAAASALSPAQAPRWVITDTALEWCKWVALAAMLLDHVNWFWFAGGGDPQSSRHAWMNDVGRVAFPLFALVFGINLARVLDAPDSRARLGRMLVRLLVAGVAAQAAYWTLRGYFWPLNVLATFALAAGVAWLWRSAGQSVTGRAASVGLFLVGGLGVEYWWLGVALILSAMLIRRAALPGSAGVFGVLLSVLCLLNGNVYALGAIAVVVLATTARWSPPRLAGLFHSIYAGHLWLLLAACAYAGRLA